MADVSYNNIYPLNSRRLTRADIIPIFGTFKNDSEGIPYAIDLSTFKDPSTNKETISRDIRFVIGDTNEQKLFKTDETDNNKKYTDRPGEGGSSDASAKLLERKGYRYTGWNYLDSNDLNVLGSSDKFSVIFPELKVAEPNKLYGKNDYVSEFEKNTRDIIIRDYVNNSGPNDYTSIQTYNNTIVQNICKVLNSSLLSKLPDYTDAAKGYLEDISLGLNNKYLSIWENDAYHNKDERINQLKYDTSTMLTNIFLSLEDDRFAHVNPSMLCPTYQFESDILPDAAFSYNSGIYQYRKFYSDGYNQKYFYQHVLYWWWRPWYLFTNYTLSSWYQHWYSYWWKYHWYWHSWYWYYTKYYRNGNYIITSSTVNEGETIRMCNAFKYNAFYSQEYIPMDPQEYYKKYGTAGTANNKANAEAYVKYLTTTYKSNIYKVKSYIEGTNKMVDKLLVVCDYAVKDYNLQPIQGYGIMYNVIYDPLPAVDVGSDSHALTDPDISNEIGNWNKDNPNEQIPNNVSDRSIISVFNTVNGKDITIDYDSQEVLTRPGYPIKPIYLLIAPAQQNNTNYIIQYKINLYQYGNKDKMETFVIYQMPKLMTASFKFECNGYQIRKDTFGILGNVNNSNASQPANVRIITNEEFSEFNCRDYHTNGITSDESKDTPYKYGIRRFYNGTSTIESAFNQDCDNKVPNKRKIPDTEWPTTESGELPILAINDQSKIVIFLSTISNEKYNHNSQVQVRFSLKTEDYSLNANIYMNGNQNNFTNNNLYGASNSNHTLHWGENITSSSFRAYPDYILGDNSKRNNNANVMFSSLTGYRIYLKYWYTSHQAKTETYQVNGQRLEVTYVWVNLGVVNKFWTTGDCYAT